MSAHNTDDPSHRFGRYFEDFAVGDEYRHWPGKTITEADNHLFCLLTMNHHPVHIDHTYAAAAHHGRPLVVGTLVFSLAVGLTVADVSGQAIANLGYDEVAHVNPTYCGDTIYASTMVLDCTPSKSGKPHGVVRVRTTVKNQDGVTVLTFARNVLVPGRSG